MRRLKIGYLMEKGEDIRRPPFNGPATHVRHVIRELCARGHSVKVLFRLEGRLWISSDLVHFEPIVVRRSDLGIPRAVERIVRRLQSTLRLPYFGFFENRRFLQACLQELVDCDIYLERMSWIMAGGAWAARRLRIPLLLEYNGDPLADLNAKGEAPTGLQLRIAVRQMRRTLMSADRVVATGDGWRADCIRTWGVPPERIVTVENGTELVERLSREQLRSFAPRPLNPAGRPTLVYVGGFNAWHGLPILFMALPEVLASFPDLRVVLIGAGPGESEARRSVASQGLDGCVEFCGALSQENYAPILAAADIGLSPYCGWPEFSGLKIFDYKAAGLACVSSGGDGMPASVISGENGLVIPPCDASALAAAILQLLRDPELCAKMGRSGRIAAESLHGWEHTARRLEVVMADVLPA